MSFQPNIGAFQTGFERFCVRIDAEQVECNGLIIAQMQPTGTATPGVEVPVYGILDAVDKFGRDSIAAKMVEIFQCQCGGELGRDTGITVLPVLDAVGSTPAEYTLTITGTVTQALGTIIIELPTGVTNDLGGQVNVQNSNAFYSVDVTAGDTDAAIATTAAAIINADPSRFFNAVAVLDVVTVTAVHGGTAFNCLGLEDRPYFGYKVPEGIALLWAQTVQGAGDPDLSVALGGLSDCCFECLAMGWSNPTTTLVLAREMDRRWDCNGTGCMGHAFTYLQDTVPNMVATAGPTDFPHITYGPLPCDYKYLGFMLSAAWAGRQCCNYCQTADPGVPSVRTNGYLSCLCDPGLCAGGPFSRDEQELMARAGIATWSIDKSGQLFIENNITNWKRNQLGQFDNRYQQVSSRYLLMTLRDLFSRFNNTYYSAHKVVANGITVPVNSRVTSPAAYKAHLIGFLAGQGEFARQIAGDLVANDDFAAGLVVWLDTYTPSGQRRPAGQGDCNRMNVALKADLIQSLLRIATTFNVQYCN